MLRAIVQDRAARADLIEIWIYSFKRWGEAQADRYLDKLKQVFHTLAKWPEQGENRSDLRPHTWSRSAARHVAFYTFTGRELRIRRVLHGSMDPGQHL